MKKIERALISVSDKTGIVELAYQLRRRGVEILSTGGTAALLAQRLTAKMHRQLIAWGYHGSAALCSPYLLPVLDKTAYKTQMTYPIPDTAKLDGRCCQPFGRSTTLWGAGKEFPVRGEDFAFMLFRKRNCCVGY